MINLSADPNYDEYAYCPLCIKWKTIDEINQKIIWKSFYEMDKTEQSQINESQSNFHEGATKIKQIVCPFCKASGKKYH